MQLLNVKNVEKLMEIKDYIVSVRLEVEATSPEVAAELMKDWLAEHVPCVFVVKNDELNESEAIFLKEEE